MGRAERAWGLAFRRPLFHRVQTTGLAAPWGAMGAVGPHLTQPCPYSGCLCCSLLVAAGKPFSQARLQIGRDLKGPAQAGSGAARWPGLGNSLLCCLF